MRENPALFTLVYSPYLVSIAAVDEEPLDIIKHGVGLLWIGP